eukprot:scaffold112932_cov26-Tisochrysis_lutea.AAC.3
MLHTVLTISGSSWHEALNEFAHIHMRLHALLLSPFQIGKGAWRRIKLSMFTGVVLLALPGANVAEISRELDTQCTALPRNETARKALSHSFAIT